MHERVHACVNIKCLCWLWDPDLYTRLQMLSLNKNPFSWNERGNISGLIGALSLTTQGGSDIPVENLNENIEVSAASVQNCSTLCPPINSRFPRGEKAIASSKKLGFFNKFQ